MAEAEPDPVAGLIDIPLPTQVSLWPQTWEARTATVLLVLGTIAGLCWLAHRWYVNRYRRAALAELREIEAGTGSAETLAALVRRTALAAFPRRQVAQMTGPAWLSFLDASYGGNEFSSGAGQGLEAAYRPAQPDDRRALVALVGKWIRTHHA
jgi:Ca-activated chloride channel family protein